MSEYYQSWGRVPKVKNQKTILFSKTILSGDERPLLPRGLGRSYGDSCLNENGTLLLTTSLNHFLEFDPESGLLTCEAGVILDEILKVFVPRGWFLPVTPGTKFVTVGGAIANDVHGKNHHKVGSFGNHVLKFLLLRSDGTEIECSRTKNAAMFAATLGGLGLTGVIKWASFKLIPISSAFIDQEEIVFNSFSEFADLSRESESGFDYVVSWVDCLHKKNLRGILIRGNHASQGKLSLHRIPRLGIPFNAPSWLLNRLFMAWFNRLFFYKNFRRKKRSRVHYDSFFYPLDAIQNWNRLYGKNGFLQYQFVVPATPQGEEALLEILAKIRESGMGSFLAVLKSFGDIAPEGILSFPQAGMTFALDFVNYGVSLNFLLDECDKILEKVKGRVYPAKDARMKPDFFYSSFNTSAFRPFIDPHFSSSFSRRVQL